MAKYKAGDILYEDRYEYARFGNHKEIDSKYPICVLRVEDVRPNIIYEEVQYTWEESYWMYNITRDINTFGTCKKIDSAETIRIANETEILIYGGGRETMEKAK